ncbi:hypothetical protein A9Q91_03745 [Candidatus Gracilibacteria bacterium 28_42_T64]|nr:hypothetical protein A9Q91_03745 [Candidatus Gracilibacteria bacterium 28_42_T64]
MNTFDKRFFQKYTPEGQDIRGIVHQHPIDVLGRVFLWLGLGALLPSFLYYYSISIKDLIPFYLLEGFLIIIYIKIIYDIFDWYNDVWIITNDGVIDLDRSIFKAKMQTISYDNIEGLEVEENGIIDKVLKKGDLIIHKIGADAFVIYDAVQPYKALNLIERVKHEIDEEGLMGQDKFDVIMDALGGVVENYLDNKGMTNKKIDDEDELIEQYQDNEDTIDLR